MNLVELSAVVTVLSAGLTGSIAAHEHRTGFSSILFAAGGAVLGLLVGFSVALVAGRFAYAALDRASCRASQSASVGFLVLYLVLPVISIAAGIAATLFLTTLIFHLHP